MLTSDLRELNERYFQALDRRDFAAAGRCFAADARAVYFSGAVAVEGRAEIVGVLSRLEAFGSSLHSPATMGFSQSSDGLAEGTVYCTATLAAAGRRLTIRGLVYEDGYRREGGDWLIAERHQRELWQYSVEAEAPQVPGPPPAEGG